MIPVSKRKLTPYVRSFGLGGHGPDVLAVKRALRASGDLKKKGPLDSVLGPWARKALVKFQKRNSVKKNRGRYSLPTHKAFIAHGLFDAYGSHLMQKASKALAPTSLRTKVVATALFAHAHAPRHYSQDMYLRMEGVNKKIKPPDMWNYADCSGFATWCYWVAGAPDPNGSGYNGFGYTGTMAQHGMRVNTPKPGDLVLYGPYPVFHHVAVYVGNGRVVSHGHESGPFLVPTYYRSDVAEYRSYLP